MKKRTWWLTLAVVGPIVGVLLGNVLLFNALPKPIRVTEPVVMDYGTEDPAFRRTMSLLMQQPVVDGNHAELYRDGEAIFAAMVEAIDAAEHSVALESYEFWGEESAGQVTDALAAASQRNVEVRVLVDFMGSTQADPSKFDRLEAAGVQVVRWRRPSWYQVARFNHRTHRKLVIADGRVGLIGGANITNDWLPGGDGAAYRDNHFAITGPVVGQMLAAFQETWLDATGELLLGEAWFPELDHTGNMAMQVVNSAPREGRHRIRKMYFYALAAANESITLATAYFYPDVAFLDALEAAADRGVRVRVLVPGDNIDQGYLRQASVNQWEAMLRAGVEIYEYQPSMFHSKLVSIDDHWASVGSANLDNRSFRINDEANVSVFDAGFAVQIRELIEDDIADSERYTLSDWEQRPWHKRTWGRVGAVIGSHL